MLCVIEDVPKDFTRGHRSYPLLVNLDVQSPKIIIGIDIENAFGTDAIATFNEEMAGSVLHPFRGGLPPGDRPQSLIAS